MADTQTQTYNATTDREDLTDMIFIVSADETPIVARAANKRATNTTHSWSIYARSAPTTAAHIEGNPITFASASLPTKVSNYTHLMTGNGISVSSSQELCDLAGAPGGSAFAFLAQQEAIFMAKKIEVTIVQSTSATGASATVRTMAGFNQILTGNAFTSSAIRDMDRTLWLSSRKSMADNGANANIFVAKNAVAVDIANWPSLVAGGSTQISGASAVAGTSVASVILDPSKAVIYDGNWKRISDPWGEVDVVFDRVGIPTATASAGALFLDTRQIAIATLDGLHLENAAKVGPSKHAWLQWEGTLEYGQQLGSGRVTAISNS